MYLLDTNMCICIINQRPPEVLERFNRLSVGDVYMSIITYGELYYGASKSKFSAQSLKRLAELENLIPPMPMSPDVGGHYGNIRAELESQGQPMGGNDLWIAAHARALDCVLVTNNTREFDRVSNLKVENWVA